MTEPERLEILCQVDDQSTDGFAFRRTLNSGERLQRALRFFGILFLVAFFSVFIPVLHFVLPELILMAAVVLAVITWMETSLVLGGEFTCPNCQRKMELRAGAEEWPKSVRCEGCSYTLQLRPRESAL